ncbi:MAG: prolipoprotein diacylglyceryl transferase [Calditrichaeota bacterium]|nr:MAG: prolipoprotein diacylglyceryl transferase [Calditrichota bacterium]
MIEWNVSPEIFRIDGFALRWYSLGFVISFLLGYYLIREMLRREKKPLVYVDDLFVYVFIGTIVGARLGHCLFYDLGYYLRHPLEILMIWHGGLASHGAAIGILVALYIFAKKRQENFLWTLDRVVIVVALAGFFIRLGNLFNSEIIGKPTDVPWAFIFTRVDNIPRHPTQIYEAIAYLGIFGIFYRLYSKNWKNLRQGYLFGLFLISVFGFRFFVEFFKEVQSPWETKLPLDMGQILSIPFVLAGIYFITRKGRAG